MCARLAAFAALLCGVGCAAPEAPAFRSIVFVSVDTLRADHLGVYGYPRPTSPFLDALADRGVVFERGLAAISTTAPSHATMLTGLYPLQHGVRRNGHRIPQSARLLPAMLAEAGWDTAGFVATRHFEASGLDAGFAHFDGPRGRGPAERSAHATIDAAARWLRERAAPEPLFLWIHLFDPHSPYRPAAPLAAAGIRRTHLASHLLDRHHLDPDFFGGDEDLMLELIEAYDGEIRAVDAALRELHAALDESLGLRDSLWIVTADHGEGLGNHGWLLHGKKIYNEQLRVPLILHAPGHFAPRRVAGVAEHVDLLPTILALLDLPVPEGLPGTSLVPVLHGAAPPERFAFAQRRSFDGARVDREPPPPLPDDPSIQDLVDAATHDNFEPGERYALQDERVKLIWSSASGSELYDLEADPYETVDLSAAQPERTRSLRERLDARIRALRAGALEEPVTEVDDESRRALESLGYLDP